MDQAQIEHPVDLAATIVGSQVALAALLGVTKAAVNQWKDEGRKTPWRHCHRIELLTHGRVTCDLLRPDLALSVARIPDKSWPHPKGRPVLDVSKVAA